MPIIDPFDFAPLGSFNRTHAYFMCTWMRCQYQSDNGNALWDDKIAALMGASNFQVFPHLEEEGFFYPRTDVAAIPGRSTVTMVRGTSVFPDEIIAEIQAADLWTQEPWAGRVGRYFGIVATRTLSRISTALQTQGLFAGHSLGGAIADMIGLGGSKFFTAGAPREGDGTYANSRPAPLKLRLVNNGDPVPLIPFSSATPLDFLDLEVPFFIWSHFFRHWGQKRVLWEDGTTTYPPHQDQSHLLEGAQLTVEFIRGGADKHYAPEYCRRLRLGFPLAFPAIKPDSDFPGLFELDAINFDLNIVEEQEPWEIGGDLSSGIPTTRRVPVPPGRLPNTDPYQFLCR